MTFLDKRPPLKKESIPIGCVPPDFLVPGIAGWAEPLPPSSADLPGCKPIVGTPPYHPVNKQTGVKTLPCL